MQAQGYLPEDAFLLEFGSNIGHFLKYSQTQVGRVLGIDPARAIVEMANARGVPTVCDYFGPRSPGASSPSMAAPTSSPAGIAARTTPTRTRWSPARGWRSAPAASS